MPRAPRSPEFRNTQLGDALQTGDMAAVAFALRHGPTVAPLVDADANADVWVYRSAETGEVALLLFSDAAHKPETLPAAVALLSPTALRDFLSAHRGTVATVFFDVAGPHPLQASPVDLLAALQV